jgi:hypothetical protein
VRTSIWLLALMAAGFGCAPERTWDGRLSDSFCQGTHDWDEHGLPKTEAECVLECIDNGASWVFVTGGQSYAIENQDYPNLSEFAGGSVRLTGRIRSGSIRVAGLERP